MEKVLIARFVKFSTVSSAWGWTTKRNLAKAVGEISRSAGERFTDHLPEYEAKVIKYVFWFHYRDDHNGVFQNFVRRKLLSVENFV